MLSIIESVGDASINQDAVEAEEHILEILEDVDHYDDPEKYEKALLEELKKIRSRMHRLEVDERGVPFIPSGRRSRSW